MLRPAGGGIHVVSTGRAEQLALQKKLYGADSEEQVRERFLRALERIAGARVIVLGVPSDVGAGYVRGASFGPQAIRAALVGAGAQWPPDGVVDVGDVLVVPQLLHDEMLSEPQKDATRRAIYPCLSSGDAASLPVSPLSMTERVWSAVFRINPRVKPFVLGGDHSVAWPVVSAIARTRSEPWGIVQPDAHTDLLAERLGIKYCFATWSYHANDLLGRGGRLVQVGIRASGRDRAHWESTLGVKQFWADECRARPAETCSAIVAHVRSTGVRGVYFSNDIDGTDSSHADATGTPEPGGLEPDFVVDLIRRLGRDVGLIGGDVMEVAPPVERTPGGAARTLSLAARYARETVAALLASST